MEDSAGSISDSSPGPHTRTDHMVEELLVEVITNEIKSTSAVVHAVQQDGDGKLTDEEASDREDQQEKTPTDPLSIDLVQDGDELDSGSQDGEDSVGGSVPADDEESNPIRLLTKKAKDSLTEALKKKTGDQRDVFASIINPSAVVKIDLVMSKLSLANLVAPRLKSPEQSLIVVCNIL